LNVVGAVVLAGLGPLGSLVSIAPG